MSDDQTSVDHRRPGPLTRRVVQPAVNGLMRLGISLWGSRILEVRGRRSGELRRVPVNLLSHEGDQYLVAPRGVTQWVRNLRVAGEGRLVLGRRVEPFAADELADADKRDVLRAYLQRWGWEVGSFFEGVGSDSSDEALDEVAADHPVFRLRRQAA